MVMDSQTVALISISVFALVVFFIAVRFKDRIKAVIKGPLGTELSVEASNPQDAPTPGVKVENARSRAGGLQAADRTGRGADVRGVDTYGDIQVTSDPYPKADPPA
jgi:hypothetical protein